MSAISEYQSSLRRLSPAGTSAVLRNEYHTLATGTVRAGDRPGTLEFVVATVVYQELGIETATLLREIGRMRDVAFALENPPKWNADLGCWDLAFSV